MKPARLATACATAVFCLTSAAAASTTNGAHDYAAGGGFHAEIPGVTSDIPLQFSAHSGALGEDPAGIVVQPPGTARVTCLIVNGNEAFITAVDERLPGGFAVWHAVDNGNPSDGTPDLFRGSLFDAVLPVDGRPGCFAPILPPVPVSKGNIVVYDAQPSVAL